MADEIVAIYRAEVEQYRKQVESLIQKDKELDAAQKQVGKTAETEFTKGGQAAQTMGSSVQGLTGQLKTMAAAIGIAFTIDRVVAFAKESIKVAAAAEGVERAFKRIGSPQLLEGLRRATRGTVSDLQLMQNAVKASNFQIPLDQLASLFKFAQQRARETGESVDYLVDSIILGIGRKSPLILDNLGISAVALREKFKGISAEAASVGDIAKAVGEIAEEAMAKVGEEADTTADKLAQIDVVFQNIMKTSGEALVNLGIGLAYITGQLDETNPRMEGFLKSLDAIKADRVKDLASGYRDLTDIYKEVDKQLQKVKGLEEELLQNTAKWDERKRMWIQTNESIARTKELTEFLIPAEKARLDMLRSLFEEEKKRKDAPKQLQSEIRNVFFLTKAIQDLNDEIKNEATSRERIKVALQEIIPLQKELDDLLNTQNNGLAGSLQRINYELGIIRTELDGAVAGSGDFWNALDRLTAKTKELTEAQAMLKFPEALIPDEEGEDASLLAKIANENKIEQDAYLAKKKNREDFDKWLKEQDEKRLQEILENDRAQVDADRQMYEDMAAAVQTYGAVAQQINSLISEAARIETEKELMALETALEAGQITREQYDQERRRLLSKQAADEKSANIFAAIISTAAAVADALPNIPLSIIAAALGAAQIAVIASQPIPKFAEGGWVDAIGRVHGRKHAQGGVKIEAEGDEFIVKGARAKQYPNIIEAVNDGTIMQLIKEAYVAPAVNAAMLNGFQDIGRSAELNGITAKLSDHNIIAAMDRNRQATTYGLAMIAEEIRTGKSKNRRGYA